MTPNQKLYLKHKFSIFQSLDAGSILPLQGVCDPVTGNTPLMYAAMENKVMMVKFKLFSILALCWPVYIHLFTLYGTTQYCFGPPDCTDLIKLELPQQPAIKSHGRLKLIAFLFLLQKYLRNITEIFLDCPDLIKFELPEQPPTQKSWELYI